MLLLRRRAQGKPGEDFQARYRAICHVALSLRSLPFHAPSRPLVRCEGFLPT